LTTATGEYVISDVNKATGHKAKDFQHSPRPDQSQGHTAETELKLLRHLLTAEHHS